MTITSKMSFVHKAAAVAVTLAMAAPMYVPTVAHAQDGYASASNNYDGYCYEQRKKAKGKGALTGAIIGGVIGGSVANTHNKGLGTVVGAGVGAAVGSNAGKSSVKCYNGEYYSYQGRYYSPPPAPQGYETRYYNTRPDNSYYDNVYYDQQHHTAPPSANGY